MLSVGTSAETGLGAGTPEDRPEMLKSVPKPVAQSELACAKRRCVLPWDRRAELGGVQRVWLEFLVPSSAISVFCQRALWTCPHRGPLAPEVWIPEPRPCSGYPRRRERKTGIAAGQKEVHFPQLGPRQPSGGSGSMGGVHSHPGPTLAVQMPQGHEHGGDTAPAFRGPQ